MLEKDRFTGTQLNYLEVCHRKLWLFSHGIEMERENEAVQIGKQIGASSYGREKKEIALGDQIVLDWAETKTDAEGVLTIHEVKKSKAVRAAHRLQMLFYLRFLREHGVEARGIIDYPEIKQRESVELSPAAETELDGAIAQVKTIVGAAGAPARLDKISFCSKCAYFDLCYV